MSLSVTCDRSVVLSESSSFLHDITEILLKVALSTIKQTNKQTLIKPNGYWYAIFIKTYLINNNRPQNPQDIGHSTPSQLSV
jgi:hypothetical protein